jgi:hypothetical protein
MASAVRRQCKTIRTVDDRTSAGRHDLEGKIVKGGCESEKFFREFTAEPGLCQ